MKKLLMTLLCLIVLLAPVSINAEEDKEDESGEINTAEPGTYFITAIITLEDGSTVEKVITVTVLHNTSIIDKEQGEAIDAKDVKIIKGTANTYNDQDWIKMARAKAWDIKTGDSIAITKVSYAGPNEHQGYTRRYSFSTTKGTIAHANVFEFDQIYLNLNQNNININDDGYYFSNYLRIFIVLILLIPLVLMLLFFMYTRKKIEESRDYLYIS